MSSHAALTGLDLHQPFHYIQEDDPGAIGAGLTWFKKSTKVLSYRNDANTGWISILASSNVNALPNGTTWAQFETAYNDTDPGDTIDLPDEEIIQDGASFWIGHKAIRFRGSTPNSKIRLVSTPNEQFFTGWADAVNVPIFFERFTMEHDRAAMGGSGRAAVFRVYGGTYGFHATGMTFLDITSTVITATANSLADVASYSEPFKSINRPIDFVTLNDNTCTEWYESFFDFHGIFGTYLQNIYIERNTCTVSSGHPNGSISRPYCTNIDVEEDDTFGGIIQNVHIHDNSFVSTMTGGDYANSIGHSMKTHGSQAELRYTRVYVTGNTYDNWAVPCAVVRVGHGGAGVGLALRSFIYILKNTFKWDSQYGIRIAPAGTDDRDWIIVGDNDIYTTNTAFFYDDQFEDGPTNVLEVPPNRTP